MIKIPKEMKSVIKTEIKANFDAEVKRVKEEMNKKYEREIKEIKKLKDALDKKERALEDKLKKVHQRLHFSSYGKSVDFNINLHEWDLRDQADQVYASLCMQEEVEDLKEAVRSASAAQAKEHVGINK